MNATSSPPPQATTPAAAPAPLPAPVQPVALMHPFRAIFRKTFTETVYLVVAAWATAGGLWFAGYYEFTGGFSHALIIPPNILMSDAMTAITILCALGGLAFGILQFARQRRFDQWTLMVHRPVSRSRLFVYSIVSALALYAAAVGAPVFLFLAWATAHALAISAFHVQYLYPHFASLILGIAAYFCGCVMSLRQARWTGTWILPFLAGALLYMLVIALPTFWRVLGFEAGAIAIFSLTAWGAALTHGRYVQAPQSARFGLAATLLVGCVLPGLMISSLTFAFSQDTLEGAIALARARIEAAKPPTTLPAEHTYTATAVLVDGRIVKERGTWRQNGPDGEPGYEREYFTTTGERILNAVPLSQADGAVVFPLRSEFLPPPPHAYRDAERAIKPFFDDFNNVATTLPESFSLPADEKLNHVFKGNQYVHRNGVIESIPIEQSVIETDRHLYVWDPNSKKLLSRLPLNRFSQKHWMLLTESPTQDVFALQYLPGGPDALDRVHETFKADGTPIASLVVDLRPLIQQEEPRIGFSAFPSLKPLFFFIGFVHASGMGLMAFPLDLWPGVPWPKPTDAFWNPYTLSGLFTADLLTAAGMLLLARYYRLRWPFAIAWSLAALCLGPLLFLVFLGLYYRPIRVPCPNCPHRRPVNEPLCPHCRTPFAAPAATGTEIFA